MEHPEAWINSATALGARATDALGRARRRRALAGIVFCAVFSPPVHAALGETEASAGRDAAQLSGTVQIMDHPSYRVHEILTATGTTVREFVSPQGTVFAVAWNGPTVPNLRTTLGKYFDQLTAAAPQRHRDHGRLALRQGDFSFESSGHMRAFSGRAYLASAIPAGVDPAELH